MNYSGLGNWNLGSIFVFIDMQILIIPIKSSISESQRPKLILS